MTQTQQDTCTPQQLYTMIKSAQGLPALVPGSKQAYVEAVNVAVS